MSEYTPTTNEMRAFYTAERLDGPHLEGFPAPTVDQAEAEFDRWLSGIQSDPAKDERVVRYMAMATPLGYQSALTVVQKMTKLIDAETRAQGLT